MKRFIDVSRAATCASGVIPECRSRESVFIQQGNGNNGSPTKFLGDDNYNGNNRSRNPAGRQTLRDDGLTAPSPRITMAGFTLIELLVVVLIIGILAAVAMPQYNKAVEKSRATQALAILKSLYAAQETYYMANGSYATSFDDLDINVPWTGSTKWYSDATDTRSNDKWSLQMYKSGEHMAIYLGRIAGEYKGAGFTMGLSGNSGKDNGILFCGERKGIGISYGKETGSYCEKIFGGTKVFEDPGLRRYRLP